MSDKEVGTLSLYGNAKLAGLVFVLGLLLSQVSACDTGSPDRTQESRNENILRIDVDFPFGSLDPSKEYFGGSTHVFPFLYSFLVVTGPDGELQGDLAVSWHYDAASFLWTIQLREDALFHDGRPVTSSDVAHTIEKGMSGPRGVEISSIKRIDPVSKFLIHIVLKGDDPEFLKKIWDADIVPALGENQAGDDSVPIGSGPFKFGYRKGNKEVFLAANEHYYGGRPTLDGVSFYFEPDKEKTWTRLLANQTDVAAELSPEDFRITQHQYQDRFRFHLYTIHYYTILLCNVAHPLFIDPRTRMALSYAIDRDYIVEHILKGYGKVAAGPMGVDSEYRSPQVTPVPFDPKEALRLLAVAGWRMSPDTGYLEQESKAFRFSLLVPETGAVEREIAQFIKICLNDIGIMVDLEPLPYDDVIRRYFKNNEFEAVLTEFGDGARSPEGLAQIWSPWIAGCSEAGCFEDTQVTRLFHNAIEEKDPGRRRALFQKADRLIFSVQPGTFLFHKTALDVMSKRFDLPVPFSLSYDGKHRLSRATLKKD